MEESNENIVRPKKSNHYALFLLYKTQASNFVGLRWAVGFLIMENITWPVQGPAFARSTVWPGCGLVGRLPEMLLLEAASAAWVSPQLGSAASCCLLDSGACIPEYAWGSARLGSAASCCRQGSEACILESAGG